MNLSGGVLLVFVRGCPPLCAHSQVANRPRSHSQITNYVPTITLIHAFTCLNTTVTSVISRSIKVPLHALRRKKKKNMCRENLTWVYVDMGNVSGADLKF